MAQAMYIPFVFILNALNMIHDADARYKQSRNKRLLVELLLIKLCYLKEYMESGSQLEVKKKLEPLSSPVINVVQQESSSTIHINPVIQEKISTKSPEPTLEKISRTATTGMLSSIKKSLSDIKHSSGSNNANATTAENNQFSEDELTEIDLQKFDECIQSLLQRLKTEQKLSLYSAVNSYPPRLINNKRIVIKVSSSYVQKLLIEDKDTIAAYIRDILKIDKISLEVEFDAEAVQRDQYIKPFTAEQRYEHMKKHNPNIEILKNKFRLDIS
jgi:DNA polymerase-3 subunit gamma/tau